MDEELDQLDSSVPDTQEMDLEALASQYGIPGPREAYAQLATSAEQARQNLREARQKIMARKYNNAIPLLAASAALGAPTRTGSFGESFGNLSAALIEPLREKQAFERQQADDLRGVDTSISGIDERMAMNALKLAQLMKKGADGEGDPASVRAFKFLARLDPEGWRKMSPKERQDMFFLSLRNPDMWTGKINEALVSVDPIGRRSTRVYSTTESEAAAAEKIAGSKTEGTKLGEAVAQAKIDLPAAEEAATTITNLLDSLKSHPGKNYVVGWPEGMNLGVVPRTSAKGFAVRLAQIKGKQFLTAYQSLRGAGAITEQEGQKAGEAEARMNSAQTVEEFDEALEEYKQIVLNGVERLRKQTALRGGAAAPESGTDSPPAQRVIKFDRNGNEL